MWSDVDIVQVDFTLSGPTGPTCGTHVNRSHIWVSNALELFLVVGSVDPTAHTFLPTWPPPGAKKCTRISYIDRLILKDSMHVLQDGSLSRSLLISTADLSRRMGVPPSRR